MSNHNPNFTFFGTSDFAVGVLDKLVENGYVPSLVATTPDKPQGRKMILTPPPVKVFAKKNNLQIIQPEKLKPELFASPLEVELPSTPLGSSTSKFDLFIVAAYGKIIPKSVLDIPQYGALNVHPSLLPKFRGPSPIQSFILSSEEKTGVSIILLDEEVDHGPILESRELRIDDSKLSSKQLEEKLAELGGQMLVDAIPKWLNGETKPTDQDHSQATFTKKITKEDGLVDINKDSPETIYRKFLAFQPWPGVYFFIQKEKPIRVIITDLELIGGKLKIKKVKPESKNEMSFEDFKNLKK